MKSFWQMKKCANTENKRNNDQKRQVGRGKLSKQIYHVALIDINTRKYNISAIKVKNKK